VSIASSLPFGAVHEEGGRQVFRWNPGETVTAMAYDNPIPGFGTNNTINLRLWAAKPDREFDLQAFNTGDYVQVGPRRAARLVTSASRATRLCQPGRV
jgi:glucan phosphorylase